jgi:hypothetical protein
MAQLSLSRAGPALRAASRAGPRRSVVVRDSKPVREYREDSGEVLPAGQAEKKQNAALYADQVGAGQVR